MINLIQVGKLFQDSIAVKQKCIKEGFEPIKNMGELATSSIRNGNKIILAL